MYPFCILRTSTVINCMKRYILHLFLQLWYIIFVTNSHMLYLLYKRTAQNRREESWMTEKGPVLYKRSHHTARPKIIANRFTYLMIPIVYIWKHWNMSWKNTKRQHICFSCATYSKCQWHPNIYTYKHDSLIYMFLLYIFLQPFVLYSVSKNKEWLTLKRLLHLRLQPGRSWESRGVQTLQTLYLKNKIFWLQTLKLILWTTAHYIFPHVHEKWSK